MSKQQFQNNINIRRVALEILTEVTEGGYFFNEVLSGALSKYQYLAKQQRSYISRVTRGVIERYTGLDAIIANFSKIPVNKLEPIVRDILRLGVYEIIYMDSIPSSATCNELVKLASNMAPRHLKGFVNGVLRNVARDIESLSDKSDEGIANHYKFQPFQQYSMPVWLYNMFKKQFGKEEAARICASFLSDSVITIRTNLSKCTPKELRESLEAEGATVAPIEEIEYGFYLSNIDYLEGLETFQKGMFYVQDLSSMMVGHKSGVKLGDMVVDVCAAPGGKSLHVAELMARGVGGEIKLSGNDSMSADIQTKSSRDEAAANVTGNVISRDLTPDKVALIQENIDRTGLTNITAQVYDATVLDKSLVDSCDIVIADLPCSGLGIMGKKPDIKMHASRDDIEALAKLQQDILSVVKSYVKPGGKLIYSTCTISKLENDDNVDWFLSENQDYSLIEKNQYLPIPGKQDGFFISILRREDTNGR